VDEVAEVLLSVMRREGLQLEEASVVAHSYGTAVAARILRQQPGKIKRLTLIDPVSVLGACSAPMEYCSV
jgi:pimeloyl-ACP methyl ester carboxylesterase